MAENTRGREQDLEIRCEQLHDALLDILDITGGWCRPMEPGEKILAIEEIANYAAALPDTYPRKEGKEEIDGD